MITFKHHKRVIGDKSIAFGSSDFENIRKQDYCFVDKSLLIQELLEDPAKIILFLRPTGFGKTTNMNMLSCFFDKSTATNRAGQSLFDCLEIWRADNGRYQAYRGKYPVIFLTFMGINAFTYQNFLEQFKLNIIDMFRSHDYLLDGSFWQQNEKRYFESILTKDASDDDYKKSLSKLIEFLYHYHNEPIMFLLDEYDAPIQAAWISDQPQYYEKLINFMDNFLGHALIDNSYLVKAVLTGIIRVVNQELFPSLGNNLAVYGVTSDKYGEYFGFH